MGTLTTLFWGISITSVLGGIAVWYLFLYIFIYFPLYGIIPIFTLKAIQGTNKKLAARQFSKISNQEAIELIKFLISLPIKTIPYVMILEVSAFIAGAFLWQLGFVPELLPLIDMATIETIILGFVVSLSAALLNFALIEDKAGNSIQVLLQKKPHLRKANLRRSHISLSKKIFILITITSFIGVFSILLFFTSYLVITNPEKVGINLMYITAVLLFTLLYIIVLAPIISKNVTRPLKLLISWSEKVSKGDLKSRILYVTDDEIDDLISDSNNMIEHLENTEQKLVESMEEISSDKDIITTERNKLSTIISEIEEGIITLDSTFSLILINKMAQQMIGIEEQSALGENIDKILIIADASDDQTEVKEELKRLYQGTITDVFSKGNYKILKTNKYVTIKARYFTSNFDQKVYFIITIRDVTNLMALEEMRLDFVSMAAHELRTPLTSIRGYVDMFIEDNKNNLTPEGLTDLTRAGDSAKRLAELVDNLLNVAKIERGSFQMNREPIDWVETVQVITEQLKVNCKNKRISLEFKNPGVTVPHVMADKLRITEVLSNLITNAINYTQEGGEIKVWIEANGSQITTHVKDNGPGIAPESQKYLFTKFFRAKRSLEQGVHGTGLGLYMSKSIVEMHNGKIWFSSEVGKGSTFSFYLPVSS